MKEKTCITGRNDAVLLGFTENNEIVFADIIMRKSTQDDDRYTFTVSFDVARPFNYDKLDKVEYWREYMSCFEDSTMLDMLKEYDCKYSELPEYIADTTDVCEVIDIYTDVDSIYIDGDEWCLELMACGQHDTRGEMAEIIDMSAYAEIHELWDLYHLKSIDERTALEVAKRRDEALNRLWSAMDGHSVEDTVKEYIMRNIDKLDSSYR